MALKDTWIDRVDGIDEVSAEDPNEIAHAVIELEKNAEIIQENAKEIEKKADEAIKKAENASHVANSLTSSLVNIDVKTLPVIPSVDFFGFEWIGGNTFISDVGTNGEYTLLYEGFANVKIKVSYKDGEGSQIRSVNINGKQIYRSNMFGDEEEILEYSGYIGTIVLEGSYLTSFTFEKFAGEIEPTLKGILESEFAKKEDLAEYASDLDTALQEIIALQEELLVPDASEVAY